jgi:GAF domain-containing protein
MRPKFSPNEIFDPYFVQGIVRHATELLRADGSGFYFWDAERRRAELLAKYSVSDVSWNDTIASRAIDSQRPLFENFPGGPALLAVPVALPEDILGTLVVADGAPTRPYTPQDVALIAALADLAASASRQTRRLARMTAQFRALHAIDIALTSSLQSNRVLDLILEKAVELVGAEHGSLRRLNAETGELILMAHYGSGWTPEKLAYTPRVGEGIAQWVAENRRPYLSSDVRTDSRYVVLFEDMRSSVAVPLLGGRRVIPRGMGF